ncbi:hypothetical protein D3C72_956720 [compost metagenome]
MQHIAYGGTVQYPAVIDSVPCRHGGQFGLQRIALHGAGQNHPGIGFSKCLQHFDCTTHPGDAADITDGPRGGSVFIGFRHAAGISELARNRIIIHVDAANALRCVALGDMRRGAHHNRAAAGDEILQAFKRPGDRVPDPGLDPGLAQDLARHVFVRVVDHLAPHVSERQRNRKQFRVVDMNDARVSFADGVPDCPGFAQHAIDASAGPTDVDDGDTIALRVALTIGDIQVHLIAMTRQAAAFLMENPDVEARMRRSEMRDPNHYCGMLTTRREGLSSAWGLNSATSVFRVATICSRSQEESDCSIRSRPAFSCS